MRFTSKIETLAILFNFSVTSWIRSPKHNAAVGGVADSRHLLGLAVDVVLDDPVADIDGFRMKAAQLGLQVIDEKDHLHLQEPRA